MRLRELNLKDAPLMYEWMHDVSVTEYLKTDFASKTLDDCCHFITTAIDTSSINLAIVDEYTDEYLGTVSLKHIHDSSAEFAITLRSKAMGKGIGQNAMREILHIAFDEKNIKIVYWCVSQSNKRAIRFYDKNGYVRDNECKKLACNEYTEKELEDYIWYSLRKQERK